MSIKKLIESSKDVRSIDSLWAVIEKAAEETKIAFAREIKEIFKRGEYDKLVFLSFTYIGIEPNVAKSCYKEILTDLEYNLVMAKDFGDFIEEFKEVEVLHLLRFIHPSYEDAFRLALTDAGKPNNICKNIFSKVLFKLIEKNEAIERVAVSTADNFDKLPYDVKINLLLELSKKEIAAKSVAITLIFYFDQLVEDDRNKLLQNLNISGKDEVAWIAARIIADNFDKLPEEGGKDLLMKFSENDEAAGRVVWAIVTNFDKIPEDIRNKLLLKLSEKEEFARNIAKAMERIDKPPNHMKYFI